MRESNKISGQVSSATALQLKTLMQKLKFSTHWNDTATFTFGAGVLSYEMLCFFFKRGDVSLDILRVKRTDHLKRVR